MLLEQVDLTFVNVCFLNRVECFPVAYKVVEVVSDAVDVTGDVRDGVIDANVLRRSCAVVWRAGTRHWGIPDAHSRVGIVVGVARVRV